MFYWEEHDNGESYILWNGNQGIGILHGHIFCSQNQMKQGWNFRNFNGEENVPIRTEILEEAQKQIEKEETERIKRKAFGNYIRG